METLSLPTTKQSGSRITAGHYPNDDLQRQVAEWIRFSLQTRHDLPLNRPLTIHLDQLLGVRLDRESLPAIAFQTFRVLVDEPTAQGITDFMPSLYIPLEFSEALVAGPFEMETLVNQINHNESPSLYLTKRILKTKLRPIEQYVFPLQAADFLEDSEGIYVYYNATRSQEDIRHGWEYGRNIVAEYYSPAYQILP